MTATKDIIKMDLSARQVAVIFFLYRKGKTRVSAVAKGTGYSSAALTYLIESLLKLGLVQRFEDKTDKRATLLLLSRKGNNLGSRL